MYKEKEAKLRRQLAINIDNAILDSGKSCRQIAEEADISVNTIWGWSSGRGEPKTILLKQFAKALGVSMDKLTEGL